nr:hypothetical protein [uncultured Pseudomonas sp.]
MTKPSGKLEFAYRTIAALEQKLEAAQARVAELESVPTRHQSLCAKHAEVIRERDELRGKLAELEKQEPVAHANRGLHAFWVKWTDAAAGLYGPGIKLYAAPVSQAGQVPDGWRVMRCTSSVPRDGDKWEIYDPQGSGGVVSVHDVKDWAVRGLLDALAAAPAQGGE